MPRNISFAMTTEQFRRREKDVTRRWGWDFLVHKPPGFILNGVEKAMGLKKGEKIVLLGQIILVSAIKEPLNRMIIDPEYGAEEMRREGYPFGIKDPAEFVERLANYGKKQPSDLITRIEYQYRDVPKW